MNIKTLSRASLILSVVAGLALIPALFVPLWRIELDAPQYPEGLALQIYPHKLGGDVEIINGLNHYIGMQTLHSENFIEFTVLPYIIGFFSLLILSILLVRTKRWLYFVLGTFALFGALAMVDFWRWNYNYGHNLDPNAAIIVPGMAYQPPLIGYKQLLNFGAYSIPDIGGWLFVGAGVMLLAAVLLETGFLARFQKKQPAMLAAIVLLGMAHGCQKTDMPSAIKLNSDKCEFCKMTLTEPGFAAALLTEKGREYKFDDLSCLVRYKNTNAATKGFRSFWAADYLPPHQWVNAETAFFISAPTLRSPMAGNVAGFSSEAEAQKAATQHNATVIKWAEVNALFQ